MPVRVEENERESGVRERESRDCEREPRVPADGCPLEPVGLMDADEFEQPERVTERERCEVASERIGLQEVASVERALELSVEGSLRSQDEQMFPHGRRCLDGDSPRARPRLHGRALSPIAAVVPAFPNSPGPKEPLVLHSLLARVVLDHIEHHLAPSSRPKEVIEPGDRVRLRETALARRDPSASETAVQVRRHPGLSALPLRP